MTSLRLQLLSLLLGAALTGGNALAQQQGDLAFEFAVAAQAYPAGEGPRVLVDEAHCNFHRAGERFRPFADLLRADGYVVTASVEVFSSETLANADVLVIANALGEAQCETWKLPSALAFSSDEIDALEAWVEAGGALLLIADHMPFPGANEELARAFGLAFIDGYARPNAGGPGIRFERSTATLENHPTTVGRSEAESIEAVVSFTGQGFRALSDDVVGLMVLPSETTMRMPVEAGEFDETTPSFSAEGLLQGAVVSHGKGRVAVFGEAAMFTAQEVTRDGEVYRFGMNAPGAEQNAQFVLNVMHWLTGLLEPATR